MFKDISSDEKKGLIPKECGDTDDEESCKDSQIDVYIDVSGYPIGDLETSTRNLKQLYGATSTSLALRSGRPMRQLSSSSAARSVKSRSNSSTTGRTTTTSLAGTQTPHSFADEEATDYPARSKKKVPTPAQAQADKAPTNISIANSKDDESDDSEDDEPEDPDERDRSDSLPKRKCRHMEPLRKGEKLTTPSSRPTSIRIGMPIDQRNKIEKFLDILDKQNRLKCETDTDFVAMLFFLVENYTSKRRCIEAFTNLLDTGNSHLRPMLREYFIMHYLIRLRPQTAKKFGSALKKAVEHHLLDFVPLDIRPKLTSIFETYSLLNTLAKVSNSRWLTNFVPDPAICLKPGLYW